MKKYNPLVSIVIPVYNGANYMRGYRFSNKSNIQQHRDYSCK